jgi:hypothetical protein
MDVLPPDTNNSISGLSGFSEINLSNTLFAAGL